MAQAGGALVLKSSPGEGTTAELWLPLAEQAEVKSAPKVEPPASTIRPLTVLVVDDDPLVLTNAVLMLDDLGHAAMGAASADEALLILEQGPVPDVVVTDQAMPRMTGNELAREIGKRYPQLPVILASGYAELPDGAALALPKLAKPFSQGELNEVLASVVAKS